MRSKHWVPLALFLASALLSARLLPALSPALSSSWSRAAAASSSPPEAARSAGMNGNELSSFIAQALGVKAEGAPGAHVTQPQLGTGPDAIQAVVQAAIYLPLWEEDAHVYMPLIRH